MSYELTPNSIIIDFAPANLIEEVLQNVRTIISTIKGTVPLDRAFGVSATWLDSPFPAAQAKLTAEIYTQIAKYEPRAVITGVSFISDMDGILVPKVQVSIFEQST